MDITTKKINKAQEEWYQNGELEVLNGYFKRYSALIEEMRTKSDLTILDIGGGAGYFSKECLEKVLAQGNSVCNINIYVLDTHRYDTWNDEDERIHFIEGDALDIDSIFTGIKFDYVLCNMFFHHLLGNSYKQSGEFRKLFMDKIKNTLRADGKVAIIDNWNDGFMWDEVSCRMIYFLTSIKNPLIIKICKKMESNAAGVGVCMLSKKMWYRLVESVGMNIIDTVESGSQKLGLLKKICLLNKSYRMYNLMILQRKEDEDGREYGRVAK